MTTSRLVVALAALAVGFAITLVGVSIADDSTELVVSPAATEPVTSDALATDRTASDETASDETTSDETTSDDETSEDDADETTDDEATAEAEPERAEPGSSEPASSGPADGGGESSETPAADASTDADEPAAVGGEEFPCSEETFERFTVELSTQEKVARSSETDLFLRVIAQRFADLGRESADTWEALLDREFEEFVTAECAEDDEQILAAQPSGGYLCVVANLSADIRLFEFFRQVAPTLMVGCSYERQQGEK